MAPAAIAHIPPAIIFLAQPANEYGAVDRSRTADDPAPRPPQGPPAERGPAFCLIGPDHGGTAEHLPGSERPPHPEQLVRAAGFEEPDRQFAACAQPAGDEASPTTRAGPAISVQHQATTPRKHH